MFGQQDQDIPRGAAVYSIGEPPETMATHEAAAQNRVKKLKGKAIISIWNGKKIGAVADISIDPRTQRVTAVIVSQGGLFDRDLTAIMAESVQVWGEDAILVNQTGTPRPVSDLSEHKMWLSAMDDLSGRYVVTTDGTRVGQIDDVWIDTDGQVVGYHLSQVFVEGPLTESHRLSAEQTHSLGKDVLVIRSFEEPF